MAREQTVREYRQYNISYTFLKSKTKTKTKTKTKQNENPMTLSLLLFGFHTSDNNFPQLTPVEKS